MFGFGKTKSNREKNENEEIGLVERLRDGLSKTRLSISHSLRALLIGKNSVDDEIIEELENILLTADLGIDTTKKIIEKLKTQAIKESKKDPETLFVLLKNQLQDILEKNTSPVLKADKNKPQVILMVGVNGAGKTTTIGKLARQLKESGEKVMLVAGDTFRAAAVDQLKIWGERNDIPVVSREENSDPASVIYEGLQIATSKGIDVLIADTAGRLQTKTNLMDELAKIKRVIKKIDENAPHEVMLVIDASTGQNALNQAIQFHKTVGITGITVSKLDGTAKGGIIFSIADKLPVPIRFIGVGEKIQDLRLFNSNEFIQALFEE